MASWFPMHGVLGMLKNALDWLVDSDVFIKNFGVK
jgi:NAD(P)H-dependent FMN reductase